MLFKNRYYFDENETSAATSSNDTEANNVAQDIFPNSEVGKDDIDKKGVPAGAMIINHYDPSKKPNINRDRDFDSNKLHEAYMEAITEYMDWHDRNTNEILLSLDEEGQNSLLVSLTNKLYKMMMAKVDDIDYGDIPGTRGDITRLPKYYEMKECLKVLNDIFEQYHENTKPVKEIENAISYVEGYHDIFTASYAGQIDLGIAMYNNITLAIISSISYMIAVCIEYIKSPKREGMEIVLDRAGITKVKESLLYENLIKFNNAARKGDIENAIRPLIKSKAKNFAVTLSGIAMGVGVVISVTGLILACISMLRDIVYYFYATRARISQYFDIQADLLEMNANELKDNRDIKTIDDKQSVIRRQIAIARNFRKIADFLAVNANKSEREATNDIKKDSKQYKIDDIETDPNGDGPLF